VLDFLSKTCCSGRFGVRYYRGWQSGWREELPKGCQTGIAKGLPNRNCQRVAKEELPKYTFAKKSFLEKFLVLKVFQKNF
jgi:hypothetical protein